MIKGTYTNDTRLLGAAALSAFAGVIAFALMQGGLSMEIGDLLLSVRSHQEGGLVVSFVKAH